MRRIISGFIISLGLFNAVTGWTCGNKQLAANKEIVTKFYNAVINQKDFATAAKYLGDHYTQHNPTAENGPEGLKKFIEFLRTQYPDAHSEVKRVFADGDFVILHVYSKRTSDSRGRAIFDLFKLKNGKIIEHWDAVQDIPAKSANQNSMF